ncbi:MAG: 4Fe-4S binding protein [Planctomycetota bacterium]
MKAKRKIVKIDEEKCNGCGECVSACAEGAIKIINGKAKLISETYCDGLGACLGECPQGAITIEERVAESFDEKEVEKHLHCGETMPCGCPSTMAQAIKKSPSKKKRKKSETVESSLENWPLQFKLLPVNAPYLQGAELLIAADCVGFAYPALHTDLLPGRAVIIGCPKLGDGEALEEKLTYLFSNNKIKKAIVAHMEVPCCHRLIEIVKQAISNSGKKIPFEIIEIGINGEKKGFG